MKISKMAHIFDHLLKPIKYCKLTLKFKKGVFFLKTLLTCKHPIKKVHEHPWFIVTSVAVWAKCEHFFFFFPFSELKNF